MTASVFTSVRHPGRTFELLSFHLPPGRGRTHALLRCERDGDLWTMPTDQLLVQARQGAL